MPAPTMRCARSAAAPPATRWNSVRTEPMIAVDSPVLFDILIGDARHAEASETCVGEALARDEVVVCAAVVAEVQARSEEHTSELQSLMRISYAVFCLKKKQIQTRKQKKDTKLLHNRHDR